MNMRHKVTLTCLLLMTMACAWMMCGAMNDLHGQCLFCCTDVVLAQERALDRAPIGVMGDSVMKMKGMFMVSIQQMRNWMAGNRNGTDDLSDAQIIKLPNPYQVGNSPTSLSVVPQHMVMNMTMLDLMYAPSNLVTLMGTGMLMSKSMDLTTCPGMGPMTDRPQLGSFTTSSLGLTSISLSGLFRLYEGDTARVHAQVGVQRSVGANNVTGEMLTPMNTRQAMVLPYGMQIGDGSTSVISALTYVANNDGWVYGGQLRSRNVIAKGEWNFGDTLSLTGWGQEELVRKTALSLRMTHHRQGAIDGRNSSIIAPVQTANPSNYGGAVTELGVGLNQLLYIFPGDYADRVGMEVTYPIHQNLNGPQMKSSVSIQFGYQKSFD
jgi:hypothetical protein